MEAGGGGAGGQKILDSPHPVAAAESFGHQPRAQIFTDPAPAAALFKKEDMAVPTGDLHAFLIKRMDTGQLEHGNGQALAKQLLGGGKDIGENPAVGDEQHGFLAGAQIGYTA